MTWGFALILLGWAIGGGSPGPATLAIAGTSMGRGRLAGLMVAAGITSGSAIWGLAAALGMGAVMVSHVWLVETLRYVGAAYLMYLAFKAMRSALADKPLAMATADNASLGQLYLKGLLVHLTNPKAVFGWGAIFVIAVPAGADTMTILAHYAALLVVSFSVFHGYALLFSTTRIVRGYQKMRRWFEATFAILFGLAGLKILTARLT